MLVSCSMLFILLVYTDVCIATIVLPLSALENMMFWFSFMNFNTVFDLDNKRISVWESELLSRIKLSKYELA